MKRILISLSLLLLLAVPAAAQAQACTIDLTDSVIQLLQAQALAASGDTGGGLAQIAEARAGLAALVSNCGAEGIEPGVLLDNEFGAPNGSFIVNYPLDWIEGGFSPNASGGGVFFGSSAAAAAALNSAVPQAEPGEQALAVAVATPALLGVTSQNPTLAEVVNTFAGISMAQFEVVSGLETAIRNDRPIARAQYRGESFEALLVGVQLPDSEHYAVVVGISAPGELEALRPIIDAVALSAR